MIWYCIDASCVLGPLQLCPVQSTFLAGKLVVFCVFIYTHHNHEQCLNEVSYDHCIKYDYVCSLLILLPTNPISKRCGKK